MKLAERILDLTTQGFTIGFQFNPILDAVRVTVKKGPWLASTDLSFLDIENTDNEDDLLVDAIENAVKNL